MQYFSIICGAVRDIPQYKASDKKRGSKPPAHIPDINYGLPHFVAAVHLLLRIYYSAFFKEVYRLVGELGLS